MLSRINFIYILLTLLFGGTCSAYGDAAKLDRELRIAVLAPLTGDYASAGEQILRGAKLAVEKLQTQNIKVKLFGEDACLPAVGVSAYRRLVDVEKIDAIGSNYCVITLSAIKPFIEKDKIPTFQNSVAPQNIFSNSQFISSTWPAVEREVNQMVKYLSQDLKITQAGIMSLQSPWGEGYRDAFNEQFERSGGHIVGIETTGFNIADFRSEITRLGSRNPKAVLLAHTGSPLANILKQSKNLGLSAYMIASSDADDDQELIKAAEGNAEGMIVFSSQSSVSIDEEDSFKKLFLDRYSTTPTALAQNAYDEVILMGNALAKCNADRICTTNAVRSTTKYKGASGEFSVLKDGTADRSFTQKQVQNGKFVVMAHK